MLFFNGLGGFTPDGREYVIGVCGDDALTPAPWVNVIANPQCGFLVSESGLGCTWTDNSQLHRLTPWNNDPTADPPGEVVYLRDERSGEVWTPTPRPCAWRRPRWCGTVRVTRHLHKKATGFPEELLLFVPLEDPFKLLCCACEILATARASRPSRSTRSGCWGGARDRAPLTVHTEIDPQTGALLARNPFVQDFGEQVAFAYSSVRPRSVAADRTEFLGRNGGVAAPAALGRTDLSGRVGAGLDPCRGLASVDQSGGRRGTGHRFLAGSAKSIEIVHNLIQTYSDPGAARAALTKAKECWENILGAVQVRTPDPAMDLMLNRWLLYQVLSCRFWGATAFYQSSGAYGFRDQLQDVMAPGPRQPRKPASTISRAAAASFAKATSSTGGTRRPAAACAHVFPTTFSGCRSWFAITSAPRGDTGILDERVPFLRRSDPATGQEEDRRSAGVDETASVRPLRSDPSRDGCRFGVHGLPLMGTGDWNDGMNRVGAEGKGESVGSAGSCARR